jgi:hypothetical protein
MLRILSAALGSGAAFLAATWPSLEISALFLVPAVGSAAGLIAGLLLAYLRTDEPSSLPAYTWVPDIAAADLVTDNRQIPELVT